MEYKILEIVYSNDVINPETQIYSINEDFNKLGQQGFKLVTIDNGIAFFIKD